MSTYSLCKQLTEVFGTADSIKLIVNWIFQVTVYDCCHIGLENGGSLFFTIIYGGYYSIMIENDCNYLACFSNAAKVITKYSVYKKAG